MPSALILVAAMALCLLPSCTQDRYLSDFCLHAEPLRPNSAAWEAADRIFKEQIVKLNEKGVELCGWEP